MTITTTPSFVFEFSADPGEYDDIIISFYQGGVPRLVKHKEDLTWDDENGALRLKECETQRMNHGNDVVISVVFRPDEETEFEAARIQRKVYPVYAAFPKVGFEDETVNVLININEYGENTNISVDADVINALRDQYLAGNGIRIDDKVISIKEDLVLDGDGTDG